MQHGYISTLSVKDENGEIRSVIDHQDDREIAERRCENLARFGKEQKVSFDLVLRHQGEPIKEWSHQA